MPHKQHVSHRLIEAGTHKGRGSIWLYGNMVNHACQRQQRKINKKGCCLKENKYQSKKLMKKCFFVTNRKLDFAAAAPSACARL